MSSQYTTQCMMGRQLALAHIQLAAQTEGLPTLTRKIREMSEDRTGLSVGYLFQIGEILTSACTQRGSQ